MREGLVLDNLNKFVYSTTRTRNIWYIKPGPAQLLFVYFVMYTLGWFPSETTVVYKRMYKCARATWGALCIQIYSMSRILCSVNSTGCQISILSILSKTVKSIPSLFALIAQIFLQIKTSLAALKCPDWYRSAKI